jgi:hypothetical protein
MAVRPIVEAEADVYGYEPADNGAGPLWCFGSTVVARRGAEAWAAGLETLPDHQPLNNCRWLLFRAANDQWRLQHRDLTGRTREPSPIALLANGELLVSANPTLALPGAYAGPAQPTVFSFAADDPERPPRRELPVWQGNPAFTEHSYRTVTADGPSAEVLYLQNTGYDVAHLSFRDPAGVWTGLSPVAWPQADEYEQPQPLRLCYPNVALRHRAAHFLGVGDIVEPVAAWRQAKYELTGREWDYVFRRLFYAWSPDITREPFGPWVEIANLDATAGHLRNGDLHLADDGRAHLVWTAGSVDARLAERFFPGQPVVHTLEYAVLEAGEVVYRRTLARAVAGEDGLTPETGRFHVPGDGRLLLVTSFGRRRTATDADRPATVFRVLDLSAGDPGSAWIDIPLAQPPVGVFVTNTARGGSLPSPLLDLIGGSPRRPHGLAWARVRLER